ncbi:MAG: hypothetical protein RSD35_09395 [Oscillospiraceae bacterium]
MADKNYGPGKKATYTYEEVREYAVAAMKDRAKTLGAFYQVMPRELFHEYATKAMFAYGAAKGDRIPTKNSPKAFSEFLVSCNSVANTCADKNSLISCTDDEAVVRFDGVCALVEGWQEMGITADEVKYLCEVQSYGDYGHTDSVGCKGEFLCNSATPGCDHCEFKITKK